MTTKSTSTSGLIILNEISEFARFSDGAQRYIRRSLDVGLGRGDPVELWGRDEFEIISINLQTKLYKRLDEIRILVPVHGGLIPLESVMSPLIILTAFDLSEGYLLQFSAYRFLYERLLGSFIRPWLPSAYCAAAVLPHINPNNRSMMLRSISDSEVNMIKWSYRDPSFLPEWIEKIEVES